MVPRAGRKSLPPGVLGPDQLFSVTLKRYCGRIWRYS